MWIITKIADSRFFGAFNDQDYITVARWVYTLRSISCLVLIGGLVQTYFTSKLKYIYILLTLLLIASVSDMTNCFYGNWITYGSSVRNQSGFNTRSGEHYLLTDAEFTLYMCLIFYGINYFCYYTAQWLFVYRYCDIAHMCIKPRSPEQHQLVTRHNQNGFFVGAVINFTAAWIFVKEKIYSQNNYFKLLEWCNQLESYYFDCKYFYWVYFLQNAFPILLLSVFAILMCGSLVIILYKLRDSEEDGKFHKKFITVHIAIIFIGLGLQIVQYTNKETTFTQTGNHAFRNIQIAQQIGYLLLDTLMVILIQQVNQRVDRSPGKKMVFEKKTQLIDHVQQWNYKEYELKDPENRPISINSPSQRPLYKESNTGMKDEILDQSLFESVLQASPDDADHSIISINQNENRKTGMIEDIEIVDSFYGAVLAGLFEQSTKKEPNLEEDEALDIPKLTNYDIDDK